MGVKPTQKPKFGSPECISRLIWGKLETLCEGCGECVIHNGGSKS
jgi:uncharacterized cysteine cluster protein YcgN (CxxCxxCC family)